MLNLSKTVEALPFIITPPKSKTIFFIISFSLSLSLIKLLKEKGYKIYIFSDNNIGVYKYLKSLDKFSDIDGWVISCEYHLVKEDKRFFEALFNTYNLNPSECFFIDNLEENIKMSKSLGMDGHVLDYENYGIEKLVEDLRNRGIL